MSSVILFGAGASYGAERFGMPPLGKALFESLRQFDPNGWGQIKEPLASKFCSDFERGMVVLSSCRVTRQLSKYSTGETNADI